MSRTKNGREVQKAEYNNSIAILYGMSLCSLAAGDLSLRLMYSKGSLGFGDIHLAERTKTVSPLLFVFTA